MIAYGSPGSHGRYLLPYNYIQYITSHATSHQN